MGFFGSPRTEEPVTGKPELEKNGIVVDDTSNVVAAELSTNIRVKAAEDSDNDELTHKDMQAGVQKIEGMAQVWPKWALYFTYAW